MIKKILAAGILAGFALAAQAHFGMVIPNHAMVVDQAQADSSSTSPSPIRWRGTA